MKSIKDILFVVIIGIVLFAQVAYLSTVYQEDKAKIVANKGEISSIERRIAQLEERVKMLPETKKELELMTSKKMAMLNTIPTFIANGKQTLELMRYVAAKDFVDISITAIRDEAITNPEDLILKNKYVMSFVGRYQDVKAFVESLNASYQIINVASLSVDNSIQELEGEAAIPYQDHFGNDFDQLVTANIDLTIFTRSSDKTPEEIYEPEYDGNVSGENSFKRIKKMSTQVSPSVSQEQPVASEAPKAPERLNATDIFTLNIGDILTSGDTYKLGGPGPNGGGYVGIISQANTHISIVIRDDGYEMSIEDENGTVDQTSVSMPITYPALEIISTMRPTDIVMPNVHVYVYNYTSKVMDVKLSGSLLDNIHVFNELDQQVRVGQTKGNIRLS